MVLIGYWPLAEESGSTAYDQTENENDGTIYDGGDSTVPGATGILGQNVYTFDGSNDYVDGSAFQYDVANGTNGYSISIWFSPAVSSSDYSGNEFVCRFRRDDNNNNAIYLPSSGQIGHNWSNGTLSSTRTWSANEWIHVCGTVTAGGGTQTLYIDGVSTGTRSNVDTDTGTHSIGIGYNPESSGNHFNGRISEVRVYNNALTQQEINYLYSVGKRGVHTSDKRTL